MALAPRVEVTAYPWREPPELKARTIEQVRAFLRVMCRQGLPRDERAAVERAPSARPLARQRCRSKQQSLRLDRTTEACHVSGDRPDLMAKPMTAPISVRLDDDVRTTLEAEARSRASVWRRWCALAAEAAREVRRERIRDKRGRGRYVATNPAARDFYAGLGTPKTVPADMAEFC